MSFSNMDPNTLQDIGRRLDRLSKIWKMDERQKMNNERLLSEMKVGDHLRAVVDDPFPFDSHKPDFRKDELFVITEIDIQHCRIDAKKLDGTFSTGQPFDDQFREIFAPAQKDKK